MNEVLLPVEATVPGVLRSLAERLARAESELAAARTALMLAEQLAASSAAPPARPDALTIEQVCEALNLAPSSVSALIRRGELRSVVVGVRSRRILRADLDAYLAGLAAAS